MIKYVVSEVFCVLILNVLLKVIIQCYELMS